jgi:spore maturation protein CgeB
MNSDIPTTSGITFPYVNAHIYAAGFDFLFPYMEPFGQFVTEPEDAHFVLTLNSFAPDAVEKLAEVKRINRPLAWWTIEDPISFEAFLGQAALADFVFTTDEACIPRYIQRLGHNRAFWLPLACSPHFHRPLEPLDGASDFVISANWYGNHARLWTVETVVDPLIRANYTLTLFCYENPHFMWPSRYHRFWQGEKSYRTVAEQYRHGRVVLGLNNMRSGMDGHTKTFSTSMRTFEALACGKPFLAAQSDAYERLDLIHGEHMVWVDRKEDTLAWADRLLSDEGQRIAEAGRQFVLAHHTYAHRLKRIADVILG